MGYLSLTEFEGDYLIIYRKDKNGKPVLSSDDVLVEKFSKIKKGRAQINLEGNNYQIARYKALKDNELKKIVDEKIGSLERKI